MCRRIKEILLIFIFVLCTPLIVWSANYYVDGSCPTSGNGSTPICGSNGPWKTLAQAASGVPSGANHTINVAAGTYSGFHSETRSGVSPGYRHWKANGSVTIASSIWVQSPASWVKFEGFTFRNISDGNTALLFDSNTHDCMVLNNTFYHCFNSAMQIHGTGNFIVQGNDISRMYGNSNADGISPLMGSNNLISGNYYHNFLWSDQPSGQTPHVDFIQTWPESGNYLSNTIIEKNRVFMGNDSTGQLADLRSSSDSLSGFMFAGAENVTIRNNLIQCWGGFNTGSGGTAPNHKIKFYNNTFVSDISFNTNWGAGIDFAGSGGSCEIYNNIIANFKNEQRGAVSILVQMGASCVGDNNLLWNNGYNIRNIGYTPSANDKTNIDPKFVSNYTDLHLQSSSPAKDAGKTIASVTDDYDGISRPQGSSYDIGAYEVVENPPLMPPSNLRIVN